ncbi:PLP-dependent aminotransferase family protein [Pseudoroseomonas cervicalis]|uniref:MocR-like pyridoxine biosynthesis transcription factor PdxR n=1 Tax=Teichococcus cervicalis TaxID=204525 RepID=UPI0027833A5D|nr:PLP-dependent aminotransferase family protein [Pseudoroseomonas cervicalis]MDQ1079664.1 GntR family transcriptional regulator/MocR family aminotransferase [Pseudoroseomonas cervicalis]
MAEPPPPSGVIQRLCQTIRARIAAGQLAPGDALPSSRALAAEWGIARGTVTAAYEQLVAEGYLEARQGARTRVAAGLGRAAAPMAAPAPAAPPERLSAYARRLQGFELPPPASAASGRLVADFRYGDLAAADFPLAAWRRALEAALRRTPPRLRYDDPMGSPALREALQAYLWRARGLRCDPAQILVVNGSQQGLDLCARLLLDAGDGAVMEEPGYILAREAFQAVGARLLPVRVDAEGLDTARLPPARLAYTTPSHQFPLGSVLSAARRRALLGWAESCGAHVIEDDYDSEYRFGVAPVPTLQAMDAAGRVIYLGTLSKTLSPTLRLGYLVLPAALAPLFARAKRLADRHAPLLEQEALAALIQSGAYERHVRRIRRRNGERRTALLAALAAELGTDATLAGAEAGLHLLAWLHRIPAAREEDFIAAARAAGLGLHPVSRLYAAPPGAGRPDAAGLVLGYAGLEPAAIQAGVALLRGVQRRFLAP